jgi:predicted ATPase
LSAENVHELIIQDLERLSSLYTISDQRGLGPRSGSQRPGATASAVRVDGFEGLERDMEPAELDALRASVTHMLVTLGQSRGAVEAGEAFEGAGAVLVFRGSRGAETHAAVALSTAVRMSQAIARVVEHLEGRELTLSAGLDSSEHTGAASGAAIRDGAVSALESCHPGEVLVTESCRDLCGDFFSWRMVEGRKASPATLYAPLETGAASTAALDRLLKLNWPEMVNRSVELDRLLGCCRKAMAEGAGGLSTLAWVCGEMGIGKTRLVEEMEARLERWETPPAFVRGRAVHFGSIPYGTWASVLRDVLRREGLPPLRASVPRLLARLEERVDVPYLRDGLPYLEALLGEPEGSVSDGTSRKTGTGLAVRCLLEALARLPGGLVLFLDNLHWIDRTSMDLLAAVLRRPPEGGRAMVVATSREQPEPEASDSLPVRLRLDLEPLDPEMVLDLARRILGADSLPQPLEEYLVSSCGGNPFHLQELIYSLVETAVVLPGEGGVEIADPEFFESPAPGVQGILIDRIGRQGEPLRNLLQLASVIDERFSARLLARLARDMEVPVGVLSALEILHSTGLVRSRGGETWEFSHSMVREAAYDTILQSGRQRLHGRVASIMEDIYDGRLEDQSATIARHWALAGEMGKAIPLAIRAMRGFVQRGELEQAEEWLARVERWLKGMPESARFLVDWEVIACRREIHGIRSELALEAEELEKMAVMAEESMNPRWLAEAEMRWGEHLYRRGDLAGARRRYRTALDTARRADLAEVRAEILQGLSAVERMAGDAELAAGMLREARSIWEQAGDGRRAAAVTTMLAATSEKLLESEAALDLYRQGLAMSREAGLKGMEMKTLYRLALFSRSSGRPSQAMEHILRGLSIARAIGDVFHEVQLLKLLGQLHLDRSEYDMAQQALERGLFLARGRDLENLEIGTLGTMGLLLRARGRVDEAVEVTERALEMAREQGAALLEGPLLCNIGGLEVERGDLDGARARFEEARELARGSQSYTTEAGILANLAYLSAVMIQKERALREYSEALALCRKAPLKAMEGRLRLNRAALLVQDGDYDGFRSDIRVVRYLAEERDSPLLEAQALREEARGLFFIGRFDRALDACCEAVSVFERLGNDQQRWRTLCLKATVHHALGDIDEADRCFGELRGAREDALPGDLRYRLNGGVAALTRSRGELEEAEDLYRKASYLREATGAPLSRLEHMVRYGRVLACNGQVDRAAHLLEKVDALEPESYLHYRVLRLSLAGWVSAAAGDLDAAGATVERMETEAKDFPGMLSAPEGALDWLAGYIQSGR